MTRPCALVLFAAIAAAAAPAGADGLSTGAGAGGPRLEIDTRIPMAPIFLTGFSAVAIAIGGGLGWQADQYYDDWKAARDAGDPYGEMDGLADDVRSHSIAADVLLFGGAAGAAIGVVWWIVAARRGRDRGERPEAAVSLRPALGPGLTGAAIGF